MEPSDTMIVPCMTGEKLLSVLANRKQVERASRRESVTSFNRGRTVPELRHEGSVSSSGRSTHPGIERRVTIR